MTTKCAGEENDLRPNLFSGREPEYKTTRRKAPTLLILGLYNTLVKQLRSDALDSRARA